MDSESAASFAGFRFGCSRDPGDSRVSTSCHFPWGDLVWACGRSRALLAVARLCSVERDDDAQSYRGRHDGLPRLHGESGGISRLHGGPHVHGIGE